MNKIQKQLKKFMQDLKNYVITQFKIEGYIRNIN